MEDHTTKRCTKCNKEYPATTEYFTPRKDSKDGLRNNCRQCQKTYNQQYYTQNGESVRSRRRVYYYDHQEEAKRYSREWNANNKDRKAEAHAKWYAIPENREYKKAYNRQRHHNNRLVFNQISRQWYWNNRDHARAYKSEYNKANKAAHVARARSYKHKKRGNGGKFTPSEVARLYNEQNGICFYCGADLENGFVRDHWIPVAKGGDSWIDNIRLACAPCNLSKGSKFPWEWEGRQC